LGALNKAIFTAENSLLRTLNIEDGGGHGLHGVISFLRKWLCLPDTNIITHSSHFVIKLLVENLSLWATPRLKAGASESKTPNLSLSMVC
jgi:hypothetical protein